MRKSFANRLAVSLHDNRGPGGLQKVISRYYIRFGAGLVTTTPVQNQPHRWHHQLDHQHGEKVRSRYRMLMFPSSHLVKLVLPALNVHIQVIYQLCHLLYIIPTGRCRSCRRSCLQSGLRTAFIGWPNDGRLRGFCVSKHLFRPLTSAELGYKNLWCKATH